MRGRQGLFPVTPLNRGAAVEETDLEKEKVEPGASFSSTACAWEARRVA